MFAFYRDFYWPSPQISVRRIEVGAGIILADNNQSHFKDFTQPDVLLIRQGRVTTRQRHGACRLATGRWPDNGHLICLAHKGWCLRPRFFETVESRRPSWRPGRAGAAGRTRYQSRGRAVGPIVGLDKVGLNPRSAPRSKRERDLVSQSPRCEIVRGNEGGVAPNSLGVTRNISFKHPSVLMR